MNRTRLHRALAVSLVALSASACGDKLLGIAGTISVSPAQLAYSQNSAIGTIQSIPVSITNQGSALLNISNIKVASDPNSELSVGSLLTNDCTGAARSGSTSLSPGECAQFTASWNPNGVHEADGSVEIDSDDAQTPVVTLPVTGNVVPIGCQFSNPSCSGSSTCCDNNCVDTQSDPANCGSCANACTSDQTCNSGVCTNIGCAASNPACTGTDACCDNACVETQSDPTHCGGCNPCAAGQTCNSGVCTNTGCADSNPPCSNGLECCTDACVNTQTDPMHCGGCNACATGDTCAAGVCVPPSNTCNPLTAPCSGTDLCCNHVCIADTPSGMCPCSSGTTSNFGVGSIIIPMDVCWQRGEDVTTTPSYCTDNRKTTGDDSPLKAYGLIFFLIRHNITVYVGIDPNKTAIDAVDMTLTSTGSTPPVQRYNWATGAAVALTDATQKTVQYRGGPFLIDASQHDTVLSLLNSNADFAQFKTAANITLHVATVAFQSAIAKTITAVPSRIALLSPKGDSSSYDILVRYLSSAGLNFTGAGGTPASPGQIYDQLQESDFLPNLAGSNLGKGGYKLLWSPHWDGGTSNTSAQLATIGQFVNAGGDLFAECAAIATLEGFYDLSLGGPNTVSGGSAATRFMTTKGFEGNSITNTNSNGSYTGPFVFGGFSSVFAQRGDFPFYGFEGAITDYFPDSSASSSYYSGVVNYVSATINGTSTQIFNSYDQHAAGKGTVVYLAGHDYSLISYGGTGDTVGTTAGSRLVLNTIFSLGTNDTCQP